jgi:hypothetical protein
VYFKHYKNFPWGNGQIRDIFSQFSQLKFLSNPHWKRRTFRRNLDPLIMCKPKQYFKLGHDHSLPHPFECNVSNLPYPLTLYYPIYLYSCCSHLEHRASVKRFVSLQFLNLSHSVGLLGRVISLSQVRYLYIKTEQNLEWDLNPWSQCLSEQRQFMPQTERTLWSAFILPLDTIYSELPTVSLKHKANKLTKSDYLTKLFQLN